MGKTRNHPRSILFLCTTNVCRGPMAAALYKRRKPADCGCIIRSAGIEGADGLPVLSVALDVAHKRGADLSRHEARIATPHLLPAFDLILAMETRQCDWIAQHVAAVTARTWLLGHWRGVEILRPMNGHQPDYERIADEIEQCLGDWVQRFPALNDTANVPEFESLADSRPAF